MIFHKYLFNIHGTGDSESNSYNILTNFFIILSTTVFSVVYQSIVNSILYSCFIYESLYIINLAKLPKQLPKVVYVYTTHNDFLPGRILQNSKQTYKNFEVWIADGSDQEPIREEIRQFAKKYNFNLCQMGIKGSATKAENLNYFLTKSGAVFDYLVVADSDESFDPCFVDASIRFFYSSKIRNLAYVTPANQTYPTRSFYSNYMRRVDDKAFWRHPTYNFKLHDYPHLYGASSLISAEFIKYIGGKFPDVVAEDIYTENMAERHGWTSIASPLTVCTQAYDVSIHAHYKRVMRVNEWVIKLDKTRPFKLYNEKHRVWFMKYFILLYIPFIYILVFLVISGVPWLCVNFWDSLTQCKLFYPFVITLASLIVIWFIVDFIFTYRLFRKFKDTWIFILIRPIYYLGYVLYILKHWCRAAILSKYSDFKSNSPKRIARTSFMMKFRQLRFDLFSFVLFGLCFGIFVFCFIQFDLVNKNLFIFILFTEFFGLFTIAFLSILLMHIMSWIPADKNFDPLSLKDLKYDNKFTQSKKIINRFYKQHPEFKRVINFSS